MLHPRFSPVFFVVLGRELKLVNVVEIWDFNVLRLSIVAFSIVFRVVNHVSLRANSGRDLLLRWIFRLLNCIEVRNFNILGLRRRLRDRTIVSVSGIIKEHVSDLLVINLKSIP